MAKDPTEENIAALRRPRGAVPGERWLRGRVRHGPPGRRPRAPPRTLLLDDIETLSGGQRRRVDLIRILFQAPDIMVLDEPTNHLDLTAKRWLMDELATFPRRPAGRQPRPAAPRPVDHEGAATSPTAASTSTRGPTRATGSSWRPTTTDASGRPSSRAARSSGSQHAGRLHARAAPTAGPAIAKSLDSGSSGSKASAPRSSPGNARASFRLPTPDALRRGAADRSSASPSATADDTVLTDVDFHRRPRRPHRRHRPQRRRQVEPAALPRRGAGAE